jgi:branched-chain amino acid transport system substrate-binding protein
VGRYQTLLTRFPNSAYAQQAAPRLADLWLATDQPGKAEELAGRLYAQSKDARGRAAPRLTQARAVWAQGRYLDALDLFLDARQLSPAQKAPAEEGVAASLYNLTQPQLAEVVRLHGQAYPGPEAAWQLAYQSAKTGDLPTFRAQAQYFRQYFPNHPGLAKLVELEANPALARDLQVPGANYSPKPDLSVSPPPGFAGPGAGAAPLAGRFQVAALLPLTEDPSSPYAQDILAGLRLALAKSQGQAGLLELDTHGEPAQAARLVNEVAARPEVLAAVGPLTSREALAAAQMAQQVSLPLLAISNRLGLTEGRSRVFRVFLTAKHQAEAVARYAVKTQGHKLLGALYPDDSYGQAMVGFFQAEAQREGGQVVTLEKYPPKSPNWKEAVEKLTGGQKPARRVAASYQAKTDFTALFLPDSAATVSQILALMAYHDVTRMTYLGTSLWLTRDLPTAAGRYLSGSVIPEAFSALSQRPETVQFREEFRQATGREPNQFAAYGHDAGLAIVQALATGATDRNSLVRQWSTLIVPGATGPFGFDAEGDYRIEPTLLTVEGSAFKLLREAGE